MTRRQNPPAKAYVPRRKWTPDEERRVRESYPNTETKLLAAEFNCKESQIHGLVGRLGVRKSKEFLREAGRKNSENTSEAAIKNRFQKHHNTWNKGLNFVAGGRSEYTRFKPNHVPPNYKPVGSERFSKSGYLQRKMTDTGYPPRDWVPVHHLVWLDAGNQIPKGHALVFRDGDKTNFALENLELISRSDLMRRNSYHNYGPEVATVIRLRGAIARKINTLARKEHEQQP